MAFVSVTLITAAAATAWDLRTGRIPNAITFPAMLAGLGLNTYYTGWRGLQASLLGLGLGVLLLFIPFALGGMGAGDVKMLAAIGALNGHLFTFRAFLYSAIAGGILAAGTALVRGKLGVSLWNASMGLGNLGIGLVSAVRPTAGSSIKKTPFMTSGITFPYAAAILTGTVAAYIRKGGIP